MVQKISFSGTHHTGLRFFTTCTMKCAGTDYTKEDSAHCLLADLPHQGTEDFGDCKQQIGFIRW